MTPSFQPGPRAFALMLAVMMGTTLAGQAAFAKPVLKSMLRPDPVLRETAPAPGDPTAAPTATPSPTPVPDLPSLFPNKFTDDQVNSCIESMCGAAPTNWGALNSILVRMKTLDPDFKKLWQGSVGPNMAIAVAADQEATSKTVDRIETLIKAGKTPQLGHPMQAVVVFQVLKNDYIEPAFAALVSVDPKTYKVTIDKDAIAKLQSLIDDKSAASAVELLMTNVFVPKLNQEIAEKLAGSDQNKLGSRLKVHYPNLSPALALKKDGANIAQTYERVKAKIGILTLRQFLDDTEVALFKKAQSGKDLSKVDSDLYVSAAEGVETAAALLEGDLYKALMGVQVDVSSGIQLVKQNDMITKKRADLAKNTAQARFEKIAPECGGRLNLAMSSTATNAQYVSLHDAIVHIKSTAKSIMPRLLAANAVPTAQKAIDKVGFMLPEPITDYAAIVEDSIDSVTTSAKESLEGLTKPTNDYDQVLLWTAPQLLAVDDSSEPLLDACKRLPIDSVSDYTLTAQGKISISWFSAAYPDVGVGIVAHEMGHVVSANLRKIGTAKSQNAPKFLSMLNCVANRNPFVIKSTALGFNDNTTWSEEDWADHFSDLVMNEFGKQKSPLETKSRDVGCALINNDGTKYSDNSIQPAAGDIHSAPLYRLVIMGMDRRQKVPTQCESFVSYAKPNDRQLSCE